MRAFTFSSIALIGLLGFSSTTTYAADLTINISEIRALTGSINIALVNDEAGWDGKTPAVQTASIPAAGETAQAVFKNIAPGSYAVQISHDENGNGKFDTNLVGIPTEGYGFSNNPQARGKPTWEQTRFDVSAAGADINIELR